jgi:hypothetical protein
MMIIRRYTPPTCSLEVQAERSFLSRLKQQPILEQFKFKLCFDDPRLPDADHITIEGDRTQLETLYQVIKNYIQNFLNFSPKSTRQSETLSLNSSTENTPAYVIFDGEPSEITIKPDGLLYHNLFFGNLSDNYAQSLVHLSVLQLFDLATALDEYATEAEQLPNLKSLEKTTPEWLKTILFIIISIGCLTSLIRLINLYRQPQTQTATQPSQTVQIPPPNLVPLPPPPTLAPLPVPSVPPPAQVKVAPNLPPVNTAPLPVPAPLFPNPASPPTFPNLTPSEPGLIIIPQDSPATDGSVPPPPPPLAAPAPPPPSVAVAQPQTPPPSPPVLFAPQTIELPTLKNAQTPIILEVPSPEKTAEKPSNSSSENSNVDEENYLAQLNKRPPTIAATRQQDTTLFDQIPQVAEVRNYFQNIWYPPKQLKRTLQYSLTLNSDGSLQNINPVGQPAVNRQKQLDFPEIGKPFVSPLESGKTPKIRLVLQPDGSVQAFLESLN